ncbi:thioredoxin [Paenibacillus polymyxa]|uniref:Thioredoxin n=1 Tax=Paenibacillus polymyxa TaxID=1406 RepID=A0AAE9LAI0_PAEPO|nr:thioredoxin [Paenibacillus polymyxa]URJ52785.1 thioredoxin [Paenibacillus polymyxa]
MGAVSLTKQNFESNINSGVTLVDFWAPWCPPCQVQLPIVNELAEDLAGQAAVAKVNVDEEVELAQQFGVRSIPTLLLFKDGKLAETMVGIEQKQGLREKILGLLN